MTVVSTTARRLAARRDLAVAGAQARVESRLARLHDETGAQAAEYAMLGGVSAAACSGLVALLRDQDTLSTIVDAVITSLGQFVGSWF